MANEVDKDEASAVNLDIGAFLAASREASTDLAGWNGAALLTDEGDPYVAGTIEHSNDDGVDDAWAAVPAEDLNIPSPAENPAGYLRLISIIRCKRYVRLTSGGTLILGHERHTGTRL